MSEQSVLTADMKKAIHERAALLYCVVCEAEAVGASPDIIEGHLAEEVGAMRAALSEVYPPERVKAIVSELLDAFRANFVSIPFQSSV